MSRWSVVFSVGETGWRTVGCCCTAHLKIDSLCNAVRRDWVQMDLLVVHSLLVVGHENRCFFCEEMCIFSSVYSKISMIHFFLMVLVVFMLSWLLSSWVRGDFSFGHQDTLGLTGVCQLFEIWLLVYKEEQECNRASVWLLTAASVLSFNPLTSMSRATRGGLTCGPRFSDIQYISVTSMDIIHWDHGRSKGFYF